MTPENAAEVGEQVNAVIDMWDAMSVENGEREDVQKAFEEVVYPLFEAVLAAEDGKGTSGYIAAADVGIYADRKPSSFNYTATAAGRERDAGRESLKVGQASSLALVPPLRQVTHSCGYVYEFYPAAFCDLNLTDTTNQGLVGEPSYRVFNGNSAYIFETRFKALKPGVSEDVRVCYYANYLMSFSSYRCNGCGATINYSNFTWYRYNDVFSLTVNADYAINYDTDGGTSIDPTTSSVADTTASLSVTSKKPTKTGYEFKGWATSKDGPAVYKGGDRLALTWEEGYGSAKKPVNQTLYAVWAKRVTWHDGYTDGFKGVLKSVEVDPDLDFKSEDFMALYPMDPTRDDCDFAGWSDPVIDEETSSFVFKAQWTTGATPGVGKYMLEYDANGGEKAPENEIAYVDYGSSYTFVVSSINPVRSGYSFLGWSTNSTLSAEDFNVTRSDCYEAKNTIKVTNVTILYAVWVKQVNSTEELTQSYAVQWLDEDGTVLRKELRGPEKIGAEVIATDVDKTSFEGEDGSTYSFRQDDSRNVLAATLGGSDVILKLYFGKVGSTTVVPTPGSDVPENPTPTPGPDEPTPATGPDDPQPILVPVTEEPSLIDNIVDFLQTPVIPVASPVHADGDATADIADDGTPLSAFDHPFCWVHYYIILGLIITAIYGGGVIARRLGYNHKIRRYEDDVTGREKKTGAAEPAEKATQPTI